MEEQGSKAINIGTALVITLVIIGIVVTIVTVALKLATNTTSQISTTSAKLNETEYTQYSSEVLTGDQVLSVVKQHEGDAISIVVNNGNGEVNYNYESSGASTSGAATIGAAIESGAEATLISNAQDKTNSAYITPTKKFSCVVCRDSNTNAITALYFAAPTTN